MFAFQLMFALRLMFGIHFKDKKNARQFLNEAKIDNYEDANRKKDKQ